jgi:hypothetical protein
LYECSVSREAVIKQRRLPDTANGLAERIGLNARLYLRDLQKASEFRKKIILNNFFIYGTNELVN